ncbi:hypothetical protein ACPC39_33975, partial [Streptomyces cellulosae]
MIEKLVSLTKTLGIIAFYCGVVISWVKTAPLRQSLKRRAKQIVRRVVTDLECVMSSWWLAPEAGAGEAAVEDAGAVLE